jgi:hypothetical protein
LLDVKSGPVRNETEKPTLSGQWFAFLLVNGGWWDVSLLHGRGDSAGDLTACAESAARRRAGLKTL